MENLEQEKVLQNNQETEVKDEGFAENPEIVFNNEFEKIYTEFMNSGFAAALNNDQLFQKINKKFNELSFEEKKKFIEHCLIDMTTLHLNAMGQIVQIRQSLFTDTYGNNSEDALDVRWLDIFLYQVVGLAFTNTIPGPIQEIKQQEVNNNE